MDSSVGQTVVDNILYWHRSLVCKPCNKFIEEDGRDKTPEDIRQALIRREGIWELYLDETTDTIKAIKVLRKTLDISLVDASELLKDCQKHMYSGTKGEAHWLRKILAAEGLKATIKIRTNVNK